MTTMTTTILLLGSLVASLAIFLILSRRKTLSPEERGAIHVRVKQILLKHYAADTLDMLEHLKPKLRRLLFRHRDPEVVKEHIRAMGLEDFYENIHNAFVHEALIETVLLVDYCRSKGLHRKRVVVRKNWQRRYLDSMVPLHQLADLVYHLRDNIEKAVLVSKGWDAKLVDRVQYILNA